MGGPALLLSLASALEHRVREVQFTLLSKYPEDDALPSKALGWNCVPYPTSAQLLLGLPFAACYRFLRWIGLPPRLLAWGPAKAYVEADVIADLSGISFSDDRPLTGLLINCLWLVPAVATGTPYVKVSQAMGPFRRAAVRQAGRYFLAKASALVARGSTTEAELHDLLPTARVQVLPDVAFALDPAPGGEVEVVLANVGLRPGEAFCAAGPSVVVEHMMGARAEPTAYARLLAHALDELTEQSGQRILLIPHARATVRNRADDLDACEAVLGLARHRDRMLIMRERLSAPLLKGIIGRATVAIGSRFHFIVAALGSGVPSAALGWSHKYREMMALLGQERFAVNHADIDAVAATGLVRELWAERLSIRSQLSEMLPELRAQAEANAEVVISAAVAR